jgi:hypothetical protein
MGSGPGGPGEARAGARLPLEGLCRVLALSLALPGLGSAAACAPHRAAPQASGDAAADGGPFDLPPADAAACTPVDKPPPDTSRPWIQIGTGLQRYDALQPCQRVPIVIGIQGGYHVWGAFRAGGFDGTGRLFEIAFSLVEAGQVVAQADYRDGIALQDGAYEYDSVLVRLVGDLVPEDVAERPATLVVHLFEAGVVDLDDSVDIVPVCCQE